LNDAIHILRGGVVCRYHILKGQWMVMSSAQKHVKVDDGRWIGMVGTSAFEDVSRV
jgi:hypothetical protein